ncbi:WYL domain-containing protein [Azotosporobacter soli]|uniref:WYL domain-containing protein n=1 Tax=Azotosporobacter soli TaxID=3055040 RepID=UPI0031FE70EF
MELFSEIHSRYFFIISEVLKRAALAPLSADDIAALVAQLGFAETPLSLTLPLLGSDASGYCLLKEADGLYSPVSLNLPSQPLTTLQQRWLKTILADPRCALFLPAPLQQQLHDSLSEVAPLYDEEQVLALDRASDGDDYASPDYRSRFAVLLQAIQAKRVVLITYESGKGNRLSAYFAPYKLEYSQRDDKFRLIALRMRQQKARSLYKLNLSRITSVTETDWSAPPGLASAVQALRLPEPVEIEISNERNGFERIFTQLSSFERTSEFDEETQTCRMKIYYYEVDEMELLITLLSFGPVIRVLGPERFKTPFVERIAKQRQLLCQTNAGGS